MRSVTVLAAVAVIAAACTTGGTKTAATTTTAPAGSTTEAAGSIPPEPEGTTTTVSPTATLVVSYRQQCCYTEGSVTHLELFRYFPDNPDAFPLEVAVSNQVAPASETVLMEGAHRPGTYELRSFQRPCGYAACRVPGYLGSSPTDGCATRLTLEPGAWVRAVIDVTPGSGCTIDVEGGDAQAPEMTMDLTLREPGSTGCNPPSPVGAAGETLATSSGDAVAWGLLWEQPPLPVEREIKMVFRLTGEGDFQAVARHEDGTEIAPSWGPNDHGQGSNYARAGNEWGMAFTFPRPGCWNLHLTRGSDTAEVWLIVSGA